MFSGKTLLITGGTGSFGHAVLKRFLRTDIAEIRIFSRDEKKQDDMRTALRSSKVKFYIGDVRDCASLDVAMRGVDYVFQAAALKQVPSCEFHPLEALKTNSLGTDNVLNAACANGVKKVIALSTDKAVYPINAMGMSKALMEKVVLAKSRVICSKQTTFCCTRYGNVMGSRGSVIPLFVSQIETGRPLTITDPNMTRFMMSLDEAVDLVLFAFEHGRSGDIFVRKAPAATIGDLVRALTELFEAENEVRIIGTRHGEKLHETLLTREELCKAVDMGDFYRVPLDDRDLNYGKYVTDGQNSVSITEDYNSGNTYRLSVAEMKELLLSLDFVQQELKAERVKKWSRDSGEPAAEPPAPVFKERTTTGLRVPR